MYGFLCFAVVERTSLRTSLLIGGRRATEHNRRNQNPTRSAATALKLGDICNIAIALLHVQTFSHNILMRCDITTTAPPPVLACAHGRNILCPALHSKQRCQLILISYVARSLLYTCNLKLSSPDWYRADAFLRLYCSNSSRNSREKFAIPGIVIATIAYVMEKRYAAC